MSKFFFSCISVLLYLPLKHLASAQRVFSVKLGWLPWLYPVICPPMDLLSSFVFCSSRCSCCFHFHEMTRTNRFQPHLMLSRLICFLLGLLAPDSLVNFQIIYNQHAWVCCFEPTVCPVCHFQAMLIILNDLWLYRSQCFSQFCSLFVDYCQLLIYFFLLGCVSFSCWPRMQHLYSIRLF